MHLGVAEIVANSLGNRYTAAVLRIDHRGRLLSETAFGKLDRSAGAQHTSVTTRFDLAALTTAFIATFVLRAVADGTLTLDSPLVEILGEWRGTPHERITATDLLAHRSGMDSGRDLRALFDPTFAQFAHLRPIAARPSERAVYADVERFALLRPLVAAVRERVIFSNLGFIVLGILLSRNAGQPLESVVHAEAAAVGANETTFRPTTVPTEAIPATDDGRGRSRLRGTVCDERAALMGGVAGHAGLFGTAADVARLTEVYLAAANGRAQNYLPPQLAREALSEHGANNELRRGLGWALKTSDDSSFGRAMSMASFGLTGRTGTGVWADPERDLSVVFLTNSIHCSLRDLRDVRAAICDAVVAKLEQS